MASDQTFSRLLKQLRENQGLSLRQIEGVTGVSNAYLSQIESGKVGPPSPRIIEKLASALDYPYVELMRAAGHLSDEVIHEPMLRLGSTTVSLADLTADDQRQLLGFVEQLRRKRSEK